MPRKIRLEKGSGNGYLKTVCDYVHLNPIRARLLAPGQPLTTFGWSSFPRYLQPPTQRPPWLRADRLLGEWGFAGEQARGRRQFGLAMEQRAEQER